jgi:hypothetical protein
MTTTTQPIGHRSKIERVLPEKGNLVICAPVGAPRVRLGYFPPANKFFLYLGFETRDAAMSYRPERPTKCSQKLLLYATAV